MSPLINAQNKQTLDRLVVMEIVWYCTTTPLYGIIHTRSMWYDLIMVVPGRSEVLLIIHIFTFLNFFMFKSFLSFVTSHINALGTSLSSHLKIILVCFGISVFQSPDYFYSMWKCQTAKQIAFVELRFIISGRSIK